MDPVTERRINSEDLEVKVLIATQGSEFKSAIVTNIENQFKLDSVFLRIIDAKMLGSVNTLDYRAIVIINTWEYGKAPKEVMDFIQQNSASMDKTIVLTTSGEGTNKPPGIDALSGESILENAGDYSDEIIERIYALLR
jgi:hypothetical protein